MGFYTGINFSFVCYRFMRFLERHIKAFFNLVMILLVLAAVVLVTQYAFKCPCITSSDGTIPAMRIVYGSLFIGVPPFIFWLAGILMHETTWRCLTGWRVHRKFTYTGRSCACCWYTLFAASLAPLAWLVFVFLEGTYLECVLAAVPSACTGDTTPSPHQAEDNLNSRVVSQIVACGIAGGAFFLFFFVYLLTQCCGSMTYYQKKYGREVNTLEEEAFEDAFKEFYNEEFKAKWKAMFNEGQVEDWQYVSELPPTNAANKMLFSPFHAWKHGQIAPFPRSQPNPDKLVSVTIRSGGEWQVNKCAQAAKLDDAEEKAKLINSMKSKEAKVSLLEHPAPAMTSSPFVVPPRGQLPSLTYPGPPNGYPTPQGQHHSMQQHKQQLLYTPRAPVIPTPQPMSDDPDGDETPIVQPKKKTKKKKVKKSQIQSMQIEDGPDGETVS